MIFSPWLSCMTIPKYADIYVGKNTKKYTPNPRYGKFAGNTILIKIKPLHYIFVGNKIVEFKTIEPISEYFSTMGNNDVPYPFALSKNYVYLMLDFVFMERIEGDPDPYPSFYDFEDKYQSKPKKINNKILVNR